MANIITNSFTRHAHDAKRRQFLCLLASDGRAADGAPSGRTALDVFWSHQGAEQSSIRLQANKIKTHSCTPSREPVDLWASLATSGQNSQASETPYQGPFNVLARDKLNMTLEIRGKPVTVAIERVKPAVTSN